MLPTRISLVSRNSGKLKTVTALISQPRSQSSSSFQLWRTLPTSTMATPSKVHLTVNDTGIVPSGAQNEEAAKKVSELLQENHDKHHIFFNQNGYHNHISHHLLTLYGLGASADVIQKRYSENASYQRPQLKVEEKILQDMTDAVNFKKYLGKEKYYPDFLAFFQREMEKKGWENVLNEYLFAADDRADALLGRMYAGFLHPIIHLGFGIEFHQPAIIAEALAQAAVHDSWTGEFLLEAEKQAKSNPSPENKSLPELVDEIRANGKLSTAAEWQDGNKVRDGILKRAREEMLHYATKWTVTENNLEEKTAEMIHNAVYFTAAAQHPPKQIKFDFYFIHCLNSSIFWPSFNSQNWLSTASKIRLLQWKGYLDLAMYASRRSPALLVSEITNYIPNSKTTSWSNVFNRFFEYKDDGHSIKLGRAIRNGELISKKWEEEGKDWIRIRGDDWEKIGNMAIDSVEDTGDTWVRSAGFDEAWEGYTDRKKKSSL